MSQSPAESVVASFRDPAGRLFSIEDRIFRTVNESGVADLRTFLDSKIATKLTEEGKLVSTRELNASELAQLKSRPDFDSNSAATVLEHERVWFPSYPYEWAPEMLHAAGLLTIEIAERLLKEKLGLKDGTPYNVLFRGPEPVFIDLLSVEKREAGDATWLPYAQFVRTFLLPLLANREFNVPLEQIFLSRRDGLEPEDVYRMSGGLQRLKPPFLGLVSMPTWLAARHSADDRSIYQKKLLSNAEQAEYILRSLLGRLRRSLAKVAPPEKKSIWTEYMVFDNNYTREHFEAKQKFVESAMQEFKPKRVLDVGCNTGHFSALAARNGAAVVGIDYDPVVVGRVWRSARAEKLNIQPIVVNLTRPTPAVGWRNQENKSFLDRARGAFDGALMLAVIHHMLVTERIPLDEIMSQAAELTADLLVIEYVDPQDSMFKRLTRGRDELHRDLNQQVFEATAQRHFDIVRSQQLENTTRRLYLMRRKRA